MVAPSKRIDKHRLGLDHGLLRWVMAEVPSIVYRIPDYAKLGIHGVSIGSNDLTQLVLGVDRDSEIVAHLFDERNDAVKKMVVSVIKAAKAKGRKIGICGQAPSDYPEFAQFLVEQGIATCGRTSARPASHPLRGPALSG